MVRASVTPVHVYGAAGMLAGELMRLLGEHPFLTPAGAITRTGTETLQEAHPHLAFDLPCRTPEDGVEALAADLERGEAVLVLALPHGESASIWRSIRERLGVLADELWVVDLSSDFRIADADAWAEAYGREHADPDEVGAWTYGLVELAGGDLRGCRRIAAPGCFATAMQLAAIPMLRAGRLEAGQTWVLSAVTGSSGSGAKAKATTHHPYRHGNLWAYALDGHRHEAELAQACAMERSAAWPRQRVLFQPHSGPFVRGIHLTATLPLADGLASSIDENLLRDDLLQAFGDSPFIQVRSGGAPELRNVIGSNRAEIAVTVREGCAIVFVVIDNLIKGGSGQALQALNVAMDLPETAGLASSGMGAC